MLHIEPSIDALDWRKKEGRFRRKFKAGRTHFREVFPCLPASKRVEQWAVIWGSNKTHKTVGGGEVIPIRELYRRIIADLQKKAQDEGYHRTIQEHLPLLRTVQQLIRWGMIEKPKRADQTVGANGRKRRRP